MLKEEKTHRRRRVSVGRSRGSPKRMEPHSRHRGVLLGRHRHRHTQQQRGALNVCRVVEVVLASLHTFCFLVDILQLHTWSIFPSPLLQMASSRFQLVHTPHHFLFLQLYAQQAHCKNDCSSSRHTHMETVR